MDGRLQCLALLYPGHLIAFPIGLKSSQINERFSGSKLSHVNTSKFD